MQFEGCQDVQNYAFEGEQVTDLHGLNLLAIIKALRQFDFEVQGVDHNQEDTDDTCKHLDARYEVCQDLRKTKSIN